MYTQELPTQECAKQPNVENACAVHHSELLTQCHLRCSEVGLVDTAESGGIGDYLVDAKSG